MAEFPALPLWTDAYLADTIHLTQAESGCYLHLLMCSWRTEDCSLPDDDELLARFAKCDRRTWTRQRKRVLETFFKKGDDGRWRQKRLTKEREFLCKLAASRRKSAAVRWQGKSKKNNETEMRVDKQIACKAYAPTPTPIEGKKEPPSEVRKKADASPSAQPSTKLAVRGSRIPESWKLSDIDLAYAQQRGLSFEAAEAMALDFEQYWRAKAGKDAVKLDWSLTWQRWVRNSENYGHNNGSNSLKEQRLHEQREIREWIVEQAFKGGVVPMAIESDAGDTDPIQRDDDIPQGKIVSIRGSSFGRS